MGDPYEPANEEQPGGELALRAEPLGYKPLPAPQNRRSVWPFALVGVLLACACMCALASCVAMVMASTALSAGGLPVDSELEPRTGLAGDGPIADFDLPPGFEPGFHVKILDFAVIGFEGGEGQIIIAQAPDWMNLDRDALIETLAQARVRWVGSNVKALEVIGTREVMVGDQPATALVGEGISGDGVAYRSLTAFFEDSGGPAVVLILEPTASWSDSRIEEFLASFR
jgi:hypothetical protein